MEPSVFESSLDSYPSKFGTAFLIRLLHLISLRQDRCQASSTKSLAPAPARATGRCRSLLDALTSNLNRFAAKCFPNGACVEVAQNLNCSTPPREPPARSGIHVFGVRCLDRIHHVTPRFGLIGFSWCVQYNYTESC